MDRPIPASNHSILSLLVIIPFSTLVVAVLLVTSPRCAHAADLYSANNQIAVEVYTEPEDAPPRTTTSDRSWYGESASFSLSHMMDEHYYDGSSVGIEVTASCPVDGSFTVSLYRSGVLIASASLNRNRFSRAEWLNVGPGRYSFRFSKSNDGATVRCSDIALFSW